MSELDDTKAKKPISFSRKVRIQDIGIHYGQLTSAMRQSGIAEDRADEVLTGCLFATCAACEVTVSGLDINRTAKSGDIVDPDFPEVQRLRLGYCVGKECDSLFYDLYFQEYPNVDWEKIWEIAEQTEIPQPDTGKAASDSLLRQLIAGAGMRNVVILGSLVMLLVMILYFQFRAPNYSTQPSGYEIDPSTDNYQINPNASGF